MDYETDRWGMVDYAWDHALISDKVYHNIKKYCNFSREGENKSCDDWMEKYNDVYDLINMYSLYTAECFEDSSSSKKRLKMERTRSKFLSSKHVSF